MKLPILAIVLLCASSALAHDLTIRVELDEPTVILRAAYDGDEPAVNADVQITSPQQASPPFQSGSTDRNGCFSFVPDTGGAWAVVVDDGFGHRREQAIEVDWSKAGGPHAEGRDWSQVVAGLGLIFGLSGVFFWSRARGELRRIGAR